MLKQSFDGKELRSRRGGGCLALFGLPFACAGVAIFLLAIGVIPITGERPPLPLALVFLVIFGSVGFGCMFGRSGVIIDKRTRTLTRWRGLLFPMLRKEFPLGEFERVVLTTEIRRSNKSTTTVYPVRLEGTGLAAVTIQAGQDQDGSRAAGEIVAKFLELPVHNRCDGGERIRAADELDDSLRERLRKRGETVTVPEPPAAMKARVHQKEGAVQIELPAPPVLPLVIMMAVPLLLFEGFALGGVFLPMLKRGRGAPLPFVAFGVLFMLAPAAVILGVAVSRRTRVRLIASRDRLSVEERSLLGGRFTEIPTDELEELYVGGRSDLQAMAQSGASGQNASPAMRSFISALAGGLNPIVARSDKVSIRFGAQLSREEADYICALIRAIVTA